MGMHDRSRRRPVIAVVLALLIGFLITCAVSDEPVRAYRVLLSGVLPDVHWVSDQGLQLTRLTRLGAVLEETVTLALLGLAMLFGLRARQFSMGADGQLFLAALAAIWVGVMLASMPVLATLAAVAAALIVGLVWGAIAGVLKARWQCNEIVTTLMLNVVAIQLYRLAITHGFNDPTAGFLATPVLPAPVGFAALVDSTNLTAMLLAVPLCAALAWFILERTTLGLEIRALGDSPAFAAAVGMPVGRTIALSMALGGVFAALAGVHLALGQLKRLPVDLAPGIGFEGLVIALLARNDPKAVPLAAFLYAYLKGGALAMERTTDVSREAILIVQALIVLLAVCQQLNASSPLRALHASWRGRAMRWLPKETAR
jgi:general nucleoside transport system permease protein